MKDNRNLFLALSLLRTELSSRSTDGKLGEQLEDIWKIIKEVCCPPGEGQAAELLEGSLQGVRHAKRLAAWGLSREAAIIAKTSLTVLLAKQDLFR